MSRDFLTEAEVLNLAIAYFQVAHTDPVTGRAPQLGPRSFLGQEARALAQTIGEVLAAAKGIDDDAIPSVYIDASGVTRTRNSKRSLDDWADTLGLPSDVPGKYGRKGATTAKNGGATATGTPGILVATAAQLTDPSGKITLKLRIGFTMPGGGSQAIVIDAVTAGSLARLPVGTLLRWTSPPPGLASTLTLTTALSGGGDIETDIELALRLVARLRDRPRGGSAYDWREWTEAAVDSTGSYIGVKRAYVYPVRDGAGSVSIVPLFGGSGRARDPGAAEAAKILAWLNLQKIATDTVYVVRPRFVSGEELTITATVEALPGFGFDWKDTVPTHAIGGTGTSCIVDVAPMSASLMAAVDNGNKPRIAINFPAQAVPFQARVTAYVLDSPVPGQTTLTLDVAMPATPANYRVYPGGGSTIPVAAAIADFVDNLGPSRSSGYGDPRDAWQDDVTVGQLAAVTLAAVDSSSGEKVVRKSPSVGLGVGITIGVGAAAGTGDDFPTFDNVPGQGPQLVELKAIIVLEAP